MANKKLTVL